MGGVLEVNHESVWGPPGWVYDDVLDEVRPTVLAVDPSLERDLRESVADGGMGYLSLAGWSHAAFRAFLTASVGLHERRLREGPGVFHEPSFYRGYMSLLAELIESLRHDPRASGP